MKSRDDKLPLLKSANHFYTSFHTLAMMRTRTERLFGRSTLILLKVKEGQNRKEGQQMKMTAITIPILLKLNKM